MNIVAKSSKLQMSAEILSFASNSHQPTFCELPKAAKATCPVNYAMKRPVTTEFWTMNIPQTELDHKAQH